MSTKVRILFCLKIFFNMKIIILFFPIFSSFLIGFCSRFFNTGNVCFFSCFNIFLAICFSFFSFFILLSNGNIFSVTLFKWIDLGLLNISWGFYFDSLTSIILVVVTTISFLVHVYSVSYIENDPHLNRFMCYLSFFTFFMLVLVTADNFLQIFIGWEGVGLCSFLLINFWFTRIQANKAAIKAIIVNRVGDFGLVLGILFLFLEFGSVKYSVVFSQILFYISDIHITVICCFLFVGAVGKSAQIGLHTWLPDAIEGPTPVSALIHAATIVTAGVFLLVRCSPLFEFAPVLLWLVTIFGGITSFFAALTGFVQHDLKKVIAYSTCSQLGYIVFACGLSSYNVGLFHLANHAFFKALLFLTAGVIIHAINDEQDIRRMGGLVQFLPVSYASISIGSLALAGFPFLTGFYSKDVILEIAFASFSFSGHFAYWLGVVGAFFTAFYSIRLLYLVFLAEPSGFKKYYEFASDVDFRIGFVLFFLSIFSIFVGFFTKEFFLGFGGLFIVHGFFILPTHNVFFDAEFLPFTVKIIPVFFSFIGLISSFLIYNFYINSAFYIKTSSVGKVLFIFFNRKWFFDRVYNEFINQKALNLSYSFLYKILDKGFFELFGPYGIAFNFMKFSIYFQKTQTGYLYHYLVLFLFSIFFISGFLSFFNIFSQVYTFLFIFMFLFYLYILVLLNV